MDFQQAGATAHMPRRSGVLAGAHLQGGNESSSTLDVRHSNLLLISQVNSCSQHALETLALLPLQCPRPDGCAGLLLRCPPSLPTLGPYAHLAHNQAQCHG
jgi:hypothetical protein